MDEPLIAQLSELAAALESNQDVVRHTYTVSEGTTAAEIIRKAVALVAADWPKPMSDIPCPETDPRVFFRRGRTRVKLLVLANRTIYLLYDAENVEELADRIKRWREDDKGGYDQAIYLLCEAEDALRAVAPSAEMKLEDALIELDRLVERVQQLEDENAELRAAIRDRLEPVFKQQQAIVEELHERQKASE